ncbi:MAG: hypothetical protein M3N49_13190, partial [Candidatus Eremiobacteraeota bacterium]|nr:hypothetical protein [Candidatus Eremiobacteraeota bacterium]
PRAAGDAAPTDAPALDTADALRVAQADGQSLESVTDGAPSAEGNKPNAPHGGVETGYRAHEPQGEGVTTETSVVDPESQHTTDAAERPGAPSTAPTAEHPEPAPGGGTHDRPELATGPADNAGTGEVGS